MFNRFEPLPAGEARERIESLLARCGFASSGLYVMDGSKRSGHGNAYFTGFGRAKRVVFFDTLLARLSGDELEAVLAHELGHFKLKHVVKRIAWSAAFSLAFLGALAWLMREPWFYAGLGIPQRSSRIDRPARCRAVAVPPRVAGVHVRPLPASARPTRAGTSSRPTRSRRAPPRARRSCMRW